MAIPDPIVAALCNFSIRPPRSGCVLLAILGSLAWNDACIAKPTREQIVALADQCKQYKIQMDLVKEFGTDFSGLDLSGVDFRGCHYAYYETILRNANFRGCNL